MSDRYDCSDPEQRAAGIKAAMDAVRRGEQIVLPTDTVYGIGADAFSPAAVAGLLAAKGRGRDMPPPVLVGTVSAATALVEDLSDIGRNMIEEFWPGGLTLVCRVSRSLTWDLGETQGTVALRMPLDQVALELLKETGPLAVSSANISGMPSALTADEAEQQLGGKVAVILDGGPATGGVPSTIVDVTGPMPRLLRAGAIGVEKLAAVALVASQPSDPAPPAEPAQTGAAAEPATGTGTDTDELQIPVPPELEPFEPHEPYIPAEAAPTEPGPADATSPDPSSSAEPAHPNAAAEPVAGSQPGTGTDPDELQIPVPPEAAPAEPGPADVTAPDPSSADPGGG